MAFDALASRMLWLYDHKNKHKAKPKTLKQSSRNVQIDLTSIQISQFAKLENKGFTSLIDLFCVQLAIFTYKNFANTRKTRKI